MTLQLDQHKQEQIKQFCERWHIAQMELFGSVLKEFTGPNERIKVLLKFEPGTSPTMGDRMNMELGLQKLFGMDRQVDLFSHSGINRTIIPHHRENILKEDTLQVYPLAAMPDNEMQEQAE